MQQLFKYCAFCFFWQWWFAILSTLAIHGHTSNLVLYLSGVFPAIFLTTISFCSKILVKTQENTLICCITSEERQCKGNKDIAITGIAYLQGDTQTHTNTTLQRYIEIYRDIKIFLLYFGFLSCAEKLLHDSLKLKYLNSPFKQSYTRTCLGNLWFFMLHHCMQAFHLSITSIIIKISNKLSAELGLGRTAQLSNSKYRKD